MVIVVIGSANEDRIFRRAPSLDGGRMSYASSHRRAAGGLGVNQAIAVARQGSPVVYAGCVGDDDPGMRILERLTSEGIDTTCVDVVEGGSTGVAFVQNQPGGAHSIVVARNANDLLTDATIDHALRKAAPGASVLLLQGETSPARLEHASGAAQRRGMRTVLSLDARVSISPTVATRCDPLIVSRPEAAWLLGEEVPTVDAARHAARTLLRSHRNVVVTLGPDGAVYTDGGDALHLAADARFPAVDVSGAGDAFAAAVCVALLRGAPLAEATAYAQTVAALTIARHGVIDAFPDAAEIASAVRSP